MAVTLSVRGRDFTFTRRLLLVAAVLACVAGYGGYAYVQQTQAIERSVPVEATVTNVTITEDDTQSGIKYDPDITFAYRYEGTNYTSDNIFPGHPQNYGERSAARDLLDPYAVGETTTAYVPPASPGQAFLERETTSTPLIFAGLGVLGLLWVVATAGAKHVETGRGTELRPPERLPASARPGPLFRVAHDRWDRLLKYAMAVPTVTGFLSVWAVLAVLLTLTDGLSRSSIDVQAGLFDPVALPFLALFVSWGALVLAVICYGLWSVREYRYLRRRISGSPPPSPFGHPLVLFATVMVDSDDAGEYVTRVKLTAASFAVAAFLLAALLGLFDVI